MKTELILAVCILPQMAFWGVVLRRMAIQKAQFKPLAWRFGEKLILGPERADYQGWNRRYGLAKTMGILGLFDHRLVFKRPLGKDIVIPLSEIADAGDTVSLGRIRHSMGKYLSLKLNDGSEVVFIVHDQRRWIDAMRDRIVPTVGSQ